MGHRLLAVTALLVMVGLVLWSSGLLLGDDRQGTVRRPVPATGPEPTVRGEAPFITDVAPSGRYFVDQHGEPILVRGDSPWSLMTDLSRPEAEAYFADRSSRGVNAVIVSVLGAQSNGGPREDGGTYDGIRPFVDGDVTDWEPAYWRRAHSYVRLAQANGVTVVLYPVDSWVVESGLFPVEEDVCEAYGRMVGEFFADLPNIIWSTGGDYIPGDQGGVTDVDHCFDAVYEGIRQSGDTRPRTIQLWMTTDNRYWRDRVTWKFVYTYSPTYRAVERAYAAEPTRPVVLGEGNYERENNQDNQPTTPETLRRQVAWALTSGAVGDFYGSDDWEFLPGWQDRLDAPGLADVGHVRDVVAHVPWWRLVPDTEGTFLTGGRGTATAVDDHATDVLDSDVATAAVAPDGSTALVYVPTARTFTIEDSLLTESVTAAWVDPSTGQKVSTAVRSTYRTPGTNASGDEDWLLVFSTP